MAGTDSKPDGKHVAIVGGGIVGMMLLIGLRRRKIPVRVYEQAAGFRELGAGIAFTACARRCMELVDPSIVEALVRCGAVSVSDNVEEKGHLRWVDGFNQHRADDVSYEKPLAAIGGGDFTGCRRDQFLEELARDIPPGLIEFGKRLDTIQPREGGHLGLTFVDGSSVEVLAVIGCDGIKSRTRQQLLGEHHPAAHAQYTHKVAYRGLIPMEQAIPILGEWTASNFHHHVGPGAHLTHYPVADHTALNVVVFLSDPEPWPDQGSMVVEGSRREVESALSGWSPKVLGMVRLLPATLIKWALFDMGDFPAPSYHFGRACLAGDAAHASSPHHGTGACMGVEDALCLAHLLGAVYGNMADEEEEDARSSHVVDESLEMAFEAFDATRRTRTQWHVNSSRRVCDLYHQSEWADARSWIKAETCFEEIRDRSYKIWHFDVDAMLSSAVSDLTERLGRQ